MLPNWEPDDTNPLYIKAGDSFELAPDALVIERAQQVVAARFCPGASVVTNVSQPIEFFRLQLGGRDEEVFAVMLLDNHHRFIRYDELFEGTASTTAIDVRRVLSCVVKSRAQAIVAAHNHPSGGSWPSRADIGLTDKLRRSLALIDVKLLDHIIVGAKVFSFAEVGWLEKPWLALKAVGEDES